MKFFTAVICFAAFILVSGALTNSCSSDADCSTGCCLKKDTGYVCEKFGDVGEVCDLDGMAEDVCPCAQGLKCQKIDLSDFGPTAAAVNPIFEKYHYGMCESDLVPIG